MMYIYICMRLYEYMCIYEKILQIYDVYIPTECETPLMPVSSESVQNEVSRFATKNNNIMGILAAPPKATPPQK